MSIPPLPPPRGGKKEWCKKTVKGVEYEWEAGRKARRCKKTVGGLATNQELKRAVRKET